MTTGVAGEATRSAAMVLAASCRAIPISRTVMDDNWGYDVAETDQPGPSSRWVARPMGNHDHQGRANRRVVGAHDRLTHGSAGLCLG
jgi:hypothetical protein